MEKIINIELLKHFKEKLDSIYLPELISNEHGHYEKHPNGKLICWGEEMAQNDSTNTDAGHAKHFTFPHPFISAPSITGSVRNATSSERIWIGTTDGNGFRVSLRTSANGSNGNSMAPDESQQAFGWFAIGMWK